MTGGTRNYPVIAQKDATMPRPMVREELDWMQRDELDTWDRCGQVREPLKVA
jgi:hypothetical protein